MLWNSAVFFNLGPQGVIGQSLAHEVRVKYAPLYVMTQPSPYPTKELPRHSAIGGFHPRPDLFDLVGRTKNTPTAPVARTWFGRSSKRAFPRRAFRPGGAA